MNGRIAVSALLRNVGFELDDLARRCRLIEAAALGALLPPSDPGASGGEHDEGHAASRGDRADRAADGQPDPDPGGMGVGQERVSSGREDSSDLDLIMRLQELDRLSQSLDDLAQLARMGAASGSAGGEVDISAIRKGLILASLTARLLRRPGATDDADVEGVTEMLI